MQAYAILDGGGVKGAALAGCLKAANDFGVEFVGYGGTSAGSIVALLATVGYTGDDLRNIMIHDLGLGNVAAEVKGPLRALEDVKAKLGHLGFWTLVALRHHKATFKKLTTDLGFVDGNTLCSQILGLVRRKLGNDVGQHFTFQDLKNLKCPPLKIVASDLGTRLPLIFSDSGGDEQNGPVLDAVRASMSYPFIFKPVRFNNRLLVDGGLCSNLPVFLFNRERERDRQPLLAFDLVVRPSESITPYDLGHFCADMADTALEAGDYLMRRSSDDIYHIRVRVPEDIGTLDFDLPPAKLEQLFDKGVAETLTFLNKELAPWQQARNDVERLQALYAPPEEVKFVLREFAAKLEREAAMPSVRAHVMLPTGRATRIVVYQFNMDSDPDQDLDLDEDAGCSGRCWTTGEPTIADLVDAATGDNYRKWKMTTQQQAKVRKDRKAMLSVPIFDRILMGERGLGPKRLLGVLSADTNASLHDMIWFRSGENRELSETGRRAVEIAKEWSGLLTRILR
jgi:NTE family protein